MADFSMFTKYSNEVVCEIIAYQLNRLIHCEGALYDHSSVVTPGDIRDVCRRFEHKYPYILKAFAHYMSNTGQTAHIWFADAVNITWRLIRDATTHLGQERTFSVKVSSDMEQWGKPFPPEDAKDDSSVELTRDMIKELVFSYARHIDVLVTADVDIEPRYVSYQRYKIFPSCNIYGSGVFEVRMVHSFTIRELDDTHTCICVGAEPINLG